MLIKVGKKKGGITLHRCRIWTEGKQNEIEVGGV